MGEGRRLPAPRAHSPPSGRWKATLEAVLAKVFWDGFLWEAFALLAQRTGHGPQTFVFALLTGLGAGLGVGLGQLSYAGIVYALAYVQAVRRGDNPGLSRDGAGALLP